MKISVYYNFVYRYKYAKHCLHGFRIQLILFWSLGIWVLLTANSQAAPIHSNWDTLSKSLGKITSNNSGDNVDLLSIQNHQRHPNILLNQLDKKHILIAAPENFNPGLRLPPAIPIPPTIQPNPIPPSNPTESVKPVTVLESIQTDFRNDTNNFGQSNLLVEPTIQFKLPNGNKIFIKTGLELFEQRDVESVTNIPLEIGWQGKVDEITLHTTVGVDVFNRLPTAINFNAQMEAPIIPPQISSSGQLVSGLIISANLEQGPYKSNIQTLENQITAWRFGPNLYWQIDRDTSLFSSLRLGNYSDRNFEIQSFSRLERKFGQFSVAANLFSWSYGRNLESTSGYFSPPDFLAYNAEVAWQGDIANFLLCRLSANLGQQRINGETDNANTYQSRCTVKVSPKIEADIGYGFSNVRNQDTGGSDYRGGSLTGQLRMRF